MLMVVQKHTGWGQVLRTGGPEGSLEDLVSHCEGQEEVPFEIRHLLSRQWLGKVCAVPSTEH